MQQINYSQLIAELAELYAGYSNTRRSSLQAYHYETVRKVYPGHTYVPDDPILSEPLIEHVGILPVVATKLYPFIDNPEVDLGLALTMLAIHDIGELKVGDTMTYLKSKTPPEQEVAEAMKLLDPMYHQLYLDIEEARTPTGKFAKSIDKFTPDLLDLAASPEDNLLRYQTMLGKDKITSLADVIKLKDEFKTPYYAWSPFFTELHQAMMNTLRIHFKL